MNSFSSIPRNLLPGLRLKLLGHGSYGAAYLALYTLKNLRLLLVLKTAHLKFSDSLNKEKRILGEFRDCPEIVRCFGNNESIESGMELYNLVLEYASLGTLSDLIRRSEGFMLPEMNVRIYTRMILKGLYYMHMKDYVHCDLKPDNILAFPSNNQYGCCQLKIADFGLTKEPDEEIISESYKHRFRGTPLYMSPESVALGEIGPALDIWSLGCVVIEMMTGKRAWHGLELSRFGDVAYFLESTKDRSPEIPQDVSEFGKDFLRRCFMTDPRQRWSALMLLHHPYVMYDVSSGLYGSHLRHH